MADICIVYASEDRHFAKQLDDHLSSQWSVWWDYELTGDFRKKIPLEIKRSRCVVAIWSEAASGKTATVGEDMQIALDNGVEIIPVKISQCEPMYGFGNLSRIDLLGWDGDSQHSGLQQLKCKLAGLVSPRQVPRRPPSLASGRVDVPGIFLSVSSHETRLDPLPAIQALQLSMTPLMLVSAYDVSSENYPDSEAHVPDTLRNLLSDYRNEGGFILLDSGHYEASRREDDAWDVHKLRRALASTPHDWAFCYDSYTNLQDTNAVVDQIVCEVKQDQCFTDSEVLPIVHASRRNNGSFDCTQLPERIFGVAQQLLPPLIAVPERELGSGIIERAKTVMNIREALNTLPTYQPLHLLGAGNPWALPILAAAGADTFDGLEWCRVVVDHDTGCLHHDQLFDFFSFQGRRGNSPMLADILDDAAVNFAGKVVFHNLAYFSEFSRELQNSAHSRNLEAMAAGLLGIPNMREVKKQIPNLFQ